MDRPAVETDNPYRRLPEPVALEDTITSQETDPVPDPDGGRNPETDFLLRHHA